MLNRDHTSVGSASHKRRTQVGHLRLVVVVVVVVVVAYILYSIYYLSNVRACVHRRANTKKAGKNIFGESEKKAQERKKFLGWERKKNYSGANENTTHKIMTVL